MTPSDTYHMDIESFRRHGKDLIDWLCTYRAEIEERPVLSRSQPGEVRSGLPPHAPEHGESFDAMLRDVDEIIMPGLTHWQSPNFFGYFPANASLPSVLGELLSAGLGVQGMLWQTSPACTELETHVLDWVVDMLDLPTAFRSTGPGAGVIQDTASSATLCALLAACERITDGVAARQGVPPGLVAYASSEAHSAMAKSMAIAGLGREHLRLIEIDEHRAMRPDRLAHAIDEDRDAGRTPAFVVATVGTTSTNAIDPLPRIGPICKEAGVWLHVDAAMSGTAALCPEFRFIHDGLDDADSYCFNPHKWMFTNFDCDCFYVRDRSPLIRALSILPEYLKNEATASGAVIDYRDWHVPLGRRFRALKLWFVIRHYGVEGLRHHVREHVALAQTFAEWVRSDDDFELVGDPPLNLVCFRHHAGERTTRHIEMTVNAGGAMFLTSTRLEGELVLRMSIGQTHTRRSHVERAWQLIRDAAATPTED